jgi:hypothetical protein
MLLGSRVTEACARVTKGPNVRATIMGLQDMRHIKCVQDVWVGGCRAATV